MEPVHLDDRAVIALEGGEARDFLQGLVTNDLATDWRRAIGLYAALLTPQGKILFDFLMTEGDGAVLLDCAARPGGGPGQKTEDVPAARQDRNRVADPSLASMPGLTGTACRTRRQLRRSPAWPALGPRSIGAAAEMPDYLPGPRAYHAERLALGVPEGARFRQRQDLRAGCGTGRTARRLLRQGLLCRPGIDGADETSRHRAQTHSRGAGRDARCRRRAQIAGDGVEIGEIISTYGRKALR